MDEIIGFGEWLARPDIAALLGFVVIAGGAAWAIWTRWFPEGSKPPPPNPDPPLGDGADRAFDYLVERIKVLEQELAEAQGHETRALLLAELDALRARVADKDETVAELRATIADLKSRIGNAPGPDADAARAALNDGDLDTAQDAFERISAAADIAVMRKADAEFALGEIAEQQVRWHDAARHFADAARLRSSWKSLNKAADYAERVGNYSEAEALSIAERNAAIAEFGEASAEEVESLNNLAELYRATGSYNEAELIYKRVIEIDRKTIGEEHPNFATHLNNLAGLYEATGRYDEAEPRYNQA
ncbi:MAG: tetratricopeptide repeat protein, partial [Pseudomonadota bacterium]